MEILPDSASANSRALSNRSAGSFSNARSICSGTFGRAIRIARGRSVNTRAMIACDYCRYGAARP
jgi:hypothetical protein